jgi:hypothetical protein
VPAQDWTVERPPYAVALVVAGSLAAVLSYFVLDWATGIDFTGVGRTARATGGGGYSVITQAYARALYLPLLATAFVAALFCAADRATARLITALAGVCAAGALIAVLIWVETGGVGTSDSRRSALPLLVVLAAGGVAALVLGLGASVDRSAVFGRALAATLAAVALVLHVDVVLDIFGGASGAGLGAWLGAAGLLVLVMAPVLPYPRVIHAA